jgi:hypothetical protein
MSPPKAKTPGKPARRKKCHAEAVNAPGWLKVETYVVAEPACTLSPAGAVHRIEVTNFALLPYDVVVTSECKSAALRYRNDATPKRVWTARLSMPSRPESSLPQPELDEGKICAVAVSAGGRLEVVPSWACSAHPGKGAMEPLSIHVNAMV